MRRAKQQIVPTALLFLCLVGASAQQRPSPVNTPIVYRVPGMDAVQVRKDIVYKNAEGNALAMDLYTPSRPANGKVPVVLLVSGGSKTKHWMFFESTARVIAAEGMAAIPFDKHYERGSYYETESDLVDAIGFLGREGEALGLDMNRVCVVVYSGGGPLLSTYLRRGDERLRCVVSVYAFLESNPWGAPAESPQRERALEEFSPIRQMASPSTRKPPMMVIRAGKDNPELNAAIDNFLKQAVASEVEIDFVNHAQGRHGFDYLDDNERSREVLGRMVHFLKARLLPAQRR